MWQRNWTPEVVEAAGSCPGKLLVLAAELNANSVERSRVTEEVWAKREVTAVFRVRVGALSQEGFGRLAEEIGRIGAGRVQLDIDVPERRLGEYAGLLKELKVRLPESVTELSVTVLPCHLRRAEFAAVVAQVDYYVLQLHGLEVPGHFDDDYSLIDGRVARQAIARARALPYRFKLALPGYAYMLWFEHDSGKFATLSAEGIMPPDGRYRGRLAGPELGLLRDLLQENRDLDVTWFRLPVSGDRLSYDLAVLKELEQGRVPEAHCTFEYRQVAKNALEIWVTPRNQLRAEPLVLALAWQRKGGEFELAREVRNLSANQGFAVLPDKLSVPFPGCGQAVRVGTFFMDQSNLLKIEEEKEK